MIYRATKKKCQHALLFVLEIYSKYLSYFLPSSCRFYPSCSCYAHEAVKEHGSLRGIYLAIRRVLCCHPWHEGGFDPVPKAFAHTASPSFTKTQL